MLDSNDNNPVTENSINPNDSQFVSINNITDTNNDTLRVAAELNNSESARTNRYSRGPIIVSSFGTNSGFFIYQ